jgi:hypothetical protein
MGLSVRYNVEVNKLDLLNTFIRSIDRFIYVESGISLFVSEGSLKGAREKESLLPP